MFVYHATVQCMTAVCSTVRRWTPINGGSCMMSIQRGSITTTHKLRRLSGASLKMEILYLYLNYRCAFVCLSVCLCSTCVHLEMEKTELCFIYYFTIHYTCHRVGWYWICEMRLLHELIIEIIAILHAKTETT